MCQKKILVGSLGRKRGTRGLQPRPPKRATLAPKLQREQTLEQKVRLARARWPILESSPSRIGAIACEELTCPRSPLGMPAHCLCARFACLLCASVRAGKKKRYAAGAIANSLAIAGHERAPLPEVPQQGGDQRRRA